MIYATYKYQDDVAPDKFYITFANTQDIWPDYKPVNATFHLENAIKKAISNGKVQEFHIKVADPANDYLKILARIIVIFLHGAGVGKDHIITDGF